MSENNLECWMNDNCHKRHIYLIFKGKVDTKVYFWYVKEKINEICILFLFVLLDKLASITLTNQCGLEASKGDAMSSYWSSLFLQTLHPVFSSVRLCFCIATSWEAWEFYKLYMPHRQTSKPYPLQVQALYRNTKP